MATRLVGDLLRPEKKRLKGFEPSTFCMASSGSRLQRAPKYLQIHGFRRRGATMAFQELPRNRSGLDKEETIRALGSRSAGSSQWTTRPGYHPQRHTHRC